MITLDIYIDKETLPPELSDLELAAFKENLSPPGTMKKPETIAAWIENNWIEKYKKMAVDTNKADIATIAWSFDKEEPMALANVKRDNKEIIQEFYKQIRQKVIDKAKSEDYELNEDDLEDDKFMDYVTITWIGFNIRTFDLDLLWKLSVKNKLYKMAKLVPRGRWDNRVIDIKEVFLGPNFTPNTFISQSAVCDFLGIKGKPDEIDGSQVYDYWMDGKVQEVVDYNIFDVEKIIELREILCH